MTEGCSEPVVTEVDRSAIRRYAAAIGEIDPACFDIDAAREAGHADLLAPPTFVYTLSSGTVPGVSLPPAGNLHGEQEFEFHRPVVAGDQVSVVRRLVDTKVRDGRSGRMRIHTFENQGTDEAGELVFVARQVILVPLRDGDES